MDLAETPSAPTGLDRIGTRTVRRADPRLTIALAAAGCALVVLGAVVVGGDGLPAGDGGGSQLPGVLLCLGVVAGGFALLVRERSGPLATAGAVASTLGVPPLLFFVTFDESSFPPYSTVAILAVSTVAWGVSWAFGPGRGRPLYLGAAAAGLWTTILELTEEVFTFPFGLFGSFAPGVASGPQFGPTFPDDPVIGGPLGPGFDDPTFGGSSTFGFEPSIPDLTVIGLLSLAFGAGYLLLARSWDRSGRAGASTPVTAVALVALFVGVQSLGDDLDTAGTGLVAIVVGGAVAAHGASVGRRATTWLGAAGAGLGVMAIVGELSDEATPGGLLLIAAGCGVVAAAEALRRAMDEPDEMGDLGPSTDSAPSLTL